MKMENEMKKTNKLLLFHLKCELNLEYFFLEKGTYNNENKFSKRVKKH